MLIDSTKIKQILGLAIPILIGGAVTTSYHLVNTFWVGRLGAEAVAVVTVALPINMMLMAIASGLTLASSILIAQSFGAKNFNAVNLSVAQSLVLLGLLSVVITIFGYLSKDYLVSIFDVSENITHQAGEYLGVTFLSTLFMMYSALYQSVLRGLGEARAPLRIIMASVVFNGILDPILIFGVGPIEPMGVQGAAWATLITQLLTAVVGLAFMYSKRFGLSLRKQDLKPNWSLMLKICKLGSPTALEQVLQSATIAVTTIIVSPFGAIAIAAYGLVFRMFMLMLMPCFSLSMAASILVGQQLGAKNSAEALRTGKYASLSAAAVMLVLTLFFVLLATPIISVFVPSDVQLAEKAVLVLQISVLAFPMLAIQLALNGVLRGAGATFTALVITVTSVWVLQMPLTYVLSRDFALGELGLWWAPVISGVLSALLTYVIYARKSWMKKSVIE